MGLLAIVPARANSLGVPDKNLRLVAGKPLVLHKLDQLASLTGIDRLVCTTDSPTIAALCRLHDYEVLTRPDDLAGPDATIGAVAAQVCRALDYDGPVVVCQPTSPTLLPTTLQLAVDEFLHTTAYDSMETAVADGHLIRDPVGRLINKAYANRQYANPNWLPTGGAMFARTVPARGGPLADAQLVGGIHHLFEVHPDEAVDIDDVHDFATANRVIAGAKSIGFYVAASDTLGTGHIRRCRQLATHLDHYDVRFVVGPDCPDWATDLLFPYPVARIPTYADDLTIFDRLDTDTANVATLRASGGSVICLEDLGPGSYLADFVINELYDDPRPNALCGPRYAVFRPEFASLPPFAVADRHNGGYRVLVAFGGTDPAGLTARIAPMAAREAFVSVLQSPNAKPYEDAGGGITVLDGTHTVAEHMAHHDLLITSAGRMAHEAAAVGIPTITIAANERESRHSHCPGILRLGLHVTTTSDQVQESIYRVLHAPDLRQEMSTTARAQVDNLGAARIAHLAEGLLAGL